MNHAEFVKEAAHIVKVLFKLRNLPAPDTDVIDFWMAAISDLGLEDLKHATKRFLKESTDYPTPAEVRKFAPRGKGFTDEQRAMKAWSQVREAMRKQGAYATVDFNDRLVNATIREVGGWVPLCDTKTEDMVWKEKEFCRHYESLAKSGRGDGSPLYGLTMRQNMQLNRHIPPVIAIDCELPRHVHDKNLRYTERDQLLVESDRQQQMVADLSRQLSLKGDVDATLQDQE